jgi:hypothetical protein
LAYFQIENYTGWLALLETLLSLLVSRLGSLVVVLLLSQELLELIVLVSRNGKELGLASIDVGDRNTLLGTTF